MRKKSFPTGSCANGEWHNYAKLPSPPRLVFQIIYEYAQLPIAHIEKNKQIVDYICEINVTCRKGHVPSHHAPQKQLVCLKSSICIHFNTVIALVHRNENITVQHMMLVKLGKLASPSNDPRPALLFTGHTPFTSLPPKLKNRLHFNEPLAYTCA